MRQLFTSLRWSRSQIQNQANRIVKIPTLCMLIGICRVHYVNMKTQIDSYRRITFKDDVKRQTVA